MMYDDHLGDVVISLPQLVTEASNNVDGVVNRVFDTGKGTLLMRTTLGTNTNEQALNIPQWLLNDRARL